MPTGYCAGCAKTVVLAARSSQWDLQKIYPAMCEQLDWKPHTWQSVACELRKLTGKRKSYRWVDMDADAEFTAFRGPDWLDTPGGLSGARFLSGTFPHPTPS